MADVVYTQVEIILIMKAHTLELNAALENRTTIDMSLIAGLLSRLQELNKALTDLKPK